MATNHVSPSGNDTTGDGSELNPFKTMTHVLTVDSDAVVNIKLDQGIYTGENIVLNDRSINVESYNGAGFRTVSGTGTFLKFNSSSNAHFVSVYSELSLTGYNTAIDLEYATKPTSLYLGFFYTTLNNVVCDGMTVKMRKCNAYMVNFHADGTIFDIDDYSNIVMVQSYLQNATFQHPTGGNYSTECFMQFSNNDARGSNGLFTPQISNSLFGGVSSSMTGNNFIGTEVTFCDVSGDGYSSRYITAPTSLQNNSCDGIFARFVSDPVANWASISAIPFAECINLAQLQAKADLDMGVGSTMHADSFLFSYTPTPPEDQPNPANRRIPAMGGMCFIETRDKVSRLGLLGGWDSSRIALTDGLVSTAYNSVFAENDFTQTTAAKRPQYGYDKTGKFAAKAADLTLTGVLVDSWGNSATATARTLPEMTGSGATRPSWNSVENAIDFATGKVVGGTAASTISMSQFSVSRYFKSAAGISLNASYQDSYVRFGLVSGSYIWMGLQAGAGSGTVTVFAAIVVSGGSAITKTYTYAQMNALLAAGYTLTACYKSGIMELFENGVSIGTNGQSSSVTIAQRTACTNTFIGATISEKTLKVYSTCLTAFEAFLLHANRDNYDYELPKNALITTGSSIMQTNLLANQTVNEFSAWAWVYMQSVRTGNGEGHFIASDTYVATPNKGFVLSQTVGSSLYYFRARFGDGTNGWGVASTALSKAAFEALYLNRWVFVCETFKNGTSKIYVNGVLDGTNIGAAGSITMPADGLVSIMGSAGAGTTRAGNKIEGFGVSKRALSGSEAKALFNEYRSKFRHLNNL